MIVAVTTASTYIKEKPDEIKARINVKVSYSFGFSFLLEFVGIMVLVCVLTSLLYKKKKVMHHGKSSRNFKKGIVTLVVVLVVFGFSYLIRIINDLYFLPPWIENNRFVQFMWDLYVGIIFDLIPIMLILLLHRRNLAAMHKTHLEDNSSLKS